MTDSTNPRILADNIKTLNARTLGTAAEVEALQNYSTDEVDTGKVYENKPVYRKIFTGTMPTITSEDTYTISQKDLKDIDAIIGLYGILNFQSYQVAMPYVNDSGKFAKVYYAETTEKIIVAANGISYSQATYLVYVEYTKADPEP